MKLYDHQKEIVNKFPEKHLLAWEMGVGKTIAAIKLADKIGGLIMVICPKQLKENWINEIDKFSDHPDRYLVIHKEHFRTDWNKLKKHECVIWDEIHHAAGIKSKIHKATKAYLAKHQVKYLYGLTGTPYLSTPLNIFALGLIFGKAWSYPKFVNAFFYKVQMGHRMVPVARTGIEDDIAELVNNMGNTIKLNDLVDVPEQIEEFEYFELNGRQRTLSKDLDEQGYIPIAKWTKLHQIEQGAVKSDGYVDKMAFDTSKTARIEELCREHTKLAIICRYNAQIDYLKDKLKKYNVFVIDGRNKNVVADVELVNNIENAVVLIQSSCAEGYNLHSVPLMIFASMDFSLKNTLQMMARIQRINHVKKNVYMFMLTEGKSIDKAVYQSFRKKEDFDIAIFNR